MAALFTKSSHCKRNVVLYRALCSDFPTWLIKENTLGRVSPSMTSYVRGHMDKGCPLYYRTCTLLLDISAYMYTRTRDKFCSSFIHKFICFYSYSWMVQGLKSKLNREALNVHQFDHVIWKNMSNFVTTFHHISCTELQLLIILLKF